MVVWKLARLNYHIWRITIMLVFILSVKPQKYKKIDVIILHNCFNFTEVIFLTFIMLLSSPIGLTSSTSFIYISPTVPNIQFRGNYL
jgi:hypothetical protein